MRRTPSRRSTLKDIAEEARVSESAVSLALNGRPGVSPSTRQRVREVADRLGWQPSAAARALNGDSTATVGLVLARPARALGAEFFFLQLVSGIQEALAGRSIGLLFLVVPDLDAECAAYRRWWAERRVDGVLVVDPRDRDPRPALLDELGLPAVFVGPVPHGEGGSAHPGISSVWASDTRAMADIVQHLHALGHRRIVHIAGLPHLAHTQRRIRSLRDEAERLGLDPAAVRSIPTDYSRQQGVEATRQVLDTPAPRPTAIVYDTDVMAVAGLGVAASLGIAVPAALTLVAWDESVLTGSTHPPLSALVRDTPAFGRRAAEELLALIDGGPARTVQDETPRLVPRGSSGPAPAEPAPAPG
ncbi:LacI family DNA-binding transcriptional regulator [Streptomyces sp. BH055]|uniref:LacI family DNA-binding transcriptional regulator n=1 Tax=Streptomyces sp. BH055 TaxID=3401173 RepID=UPI003BB6A158